MQPITTGTELLSSFFTGSLWSWTNAGNSKPCVKEGSSMVEASEPIWAHNVEAGSPVNAEGRPGQLMAPSMMAKHAQAMADDKVTEAPMPMDHFKTPTARLDASQPLAQGTELETAQHSARTESSEEAHANVGSDIVGPAVEACPELILMEEIYEGLNVTFTVEAVDEDAPSTSPRESVLADIANIALALQGDWPIGLGPNDMHELLEVRHGAAAVDAAAAEDAADKAEEAALAASLGGDDPIGLSSDEMRQLVKMRRHPEESQEELHDDATPLPDRLQAKGTPGQAITPAVLAKHSPANAEHQAAEVWRQLSFEAAVEGDTETATAGSPTSAAEPDRDAVAARAVQAEWLEREIHVRPMEVQAEWLARRVQEIERSLYVETPSLLQPLPTPARTAPADERHSHPLPAGARKPLRGGNGADPMSTIASSRTRRTRAGGGAARPRRGGCYGAACGEGCVWSR
jgi:hypothetical protein